MEPNAILAISSLDRYNRNQNTGGQFASTSEALANQYNGTGQPCNNFQVGGFGALIYGYIKKIIISQTQIQYNVPTIIPGSNDRFFIYAYNISTGITTKVLIEIPYGYYTPEELAPVMETLINESPFPVTINVFYSERGSVFTFEPNTVDGYYVYFPDIIQIQTQLILLGYEPNAYVVILKCYKLLGMDLVNSTPAAIQTSNVQINFLYTPYVDIFSTALTKYQKVKDNTTIASSDSTLVVRIFLAGMGGPQNTGGEETITTSNYYPLGSRPFIVIQDCNSPKIIRWSKDETVYALDFQLRDQYGELLYTQYNPTAALIPINPNEAANVDFYYTEFQMTLMCVEGGRE
jgi:hypothetical protein